MQKPFTLSVKIVVRNREGRCLVLRRAATSKGNAGKWDFPGGKLEPGEQIEQALCRETIEETGLVTSVERVVGAAQSELPDRIVAYLFMEGFVQGGEIRLSEEHDGYEWVTVPELATMELAPQFKAFANTYATAR